MLNGSYMGTDIGIEKNGHVLSQHECNDTCMRWKRPKLENFRVKIPQSTCQQMLLQVNNTVIITRLE